MLDVLFKYHPELIKKIGNKGNILLTSLSVLSSKFRDWSNDPKSIPPSGSIIDVITISEEGTETNNDNKVIQTEFLIRKNI